MQFSSLFFGIAALAMTAAAIPTNDKPPTCDGTSDKPVCCDNKDGVISVDVCNLLGGSSCSGSAYCCTTNSEGIVNINALDCVTLAL